jgi:hypothetical protein
MQLTEGQILYGLGGLVGALVFIWKLMDSRLEKRIEALEAALEEKDAQLEELRKQVNELSPKAALLTLCPEKRCPMKPPGQWTGAVGKAGVVLLLCFLSSCVGYRKTASTETLVGIGMDADKVELASGASITGMNTSRAMKDGAQAIKDLTRMRLNTNIVTSGIKAAQNVTTDAVK